MGKKSRYKIYANKYSFKIEGGEGRYPVLVRLNENRTGFEVIRKHVIVNHYTNQIAPLGSSQQEAFQVPLPHLYKLNRHIVSTIMLGYKAPDRPNKKPDPYIIEQWAKKQTAKALSKRVKRQWLRLKEHVDPDILAVQNRIFSVTLLVPAYMLTELDFYKDKYIIRDIMKYRAAAAVAGKLNSHALGGSWSPTREDWQYLENWMGLYSPNGEAYPALRKTLMNLPNSFPPGPLQLIDNMFLPEAIKDKWLLMAYATIAQRVSHYAYYADENMDEQIRNNEWLARWIPVLQRTTGEEVRAVMDYLAPLTEWWTGPRTWARLRQTMRYIIDYPDSVENISLMGAVRRAVEWHDTEYDRDLAERMERTGYTLETPTSAPPIELPDNEHVTFLSVAGAVWEEGKEMKHCVGSYAQQAVKGSSYLFHVEYEEDIATVEVTYDGRVNQAYGPRNTTNKATKYGTQVLTHWGNGFPHERIQSHRGMRPDRGVDLGMQVEIPF